MIKMRINFNLDQFRKERTENLKKKQEIVRIIKKDIQNKIDFYKFKEEDFEWNKVPYAPQETNETTL